MPDTINPAATSDPRALRALAHPVRWKLIDVLASEGTATVTRCAEVLGESTATCSYHLGILAKYGYIARAGARHGRQKPWQLVQPDLDLGSADLDTEGALASRAAAAAFLDFQLAWLKDSIQRSDLQPEPWRQTSKVMAAITWVTAAESQQIADEFSRILAAYSGRRKTPALRPQGAREVRLLAAIGLAPAVPGRQ